MCSRVGRKDGDLGAATTTTGRRRKDIKNRQRSFEGIASAGARPNAEGATVLVAPSYMFICPHYAGFLLVFLKEILV